MATISKNGSVHFDENAHSIIPYKGIRLVVDKVKWGWIVSESRLIMRAEGDTMEEAIEAAKKRWDEIEDEYKDFPL